MSGQVVSKDVRKMNHTQWRIKTLRVPDALEEMRALFPTKQEDDKIYYSNVKLRVNEASKWSAH